MVDEIIARMSLKVSRNEMRIDIMKIESPLCLTIERQYCKEKDIGSNLNLEDGFRVKKLASLVNQKVANLLRNNSLRQKLSDVSSLN